jgi:predicted 3-demethylubiquinone-9 3-methyltransferase (glyoxalase superfamily)
MADKLSICLWFEGTAEDAARFYCELFPDSGIKDIHHAPASRAGNGHQQMVKIDHAGIEAAIAGDAR